MEKQPARTNLAFGSHVGTRWEIQDTDEECVNVLYFGKERLTVTYPKDADVKIKFEPDYQKPDAARSE